MKKFFYSMLAVLAIAATAALFTSCSEDEDTIVFISLGIQELNISGIGNEDAAVWTFSSEVETAYKKALGMTDGNTLILKNVDYKTTCADMKRKFESATLPSQPSLSCSYRLTYALSASTGSDNTETIATKTFTNK